MVSSRADPTRFGQAALDPAKLVQQLRDDYPCANTCWVAFSGGLDSTVLLTVLAEQRAELPFTLKAVHVDHGLQPGSADWAVHCAEVCRSLGIPLSGLTVDAHPRRGESPEAVARAARYAAIENLMEDGDLLLTAHHRNDQAETVLLQLLRAAGVAGLAAMPALKRFGVGWHGRPLLDLPRSALRRWAEERSLEWIEDPSNALINADRNYLRHEVLPRLFTRWPATEASLAASASHAAETLEALQQQAAEDLDQVRVDQHRLDISSLSKLSMHRRRAVLQAWFREFELVMPSAGTLGEMLRQLMEADPDRGPCFCLGERQLRRYRDMAWLVMPPPSATPAGSVLAWPSGADQVELPFGTLRLVRRSPGIALQRWSSGRAEIRFRNAKVSCRRHGRQGAKDFKELAQECAVPPWLRPWWPLLFIDGELAAVANGVVCEPFLDRKEGWWPVWSELPDMESKR